MADVMLTVTVKAIIRLSREHVVFRLLGCSWACRSPARQRVKRRSRCDTSSGPISSVLPCRKLWQPRPRQPRVAWERVSASLDQSDYLSRWRWTIDRTRRATHGHTADSRGAAMSRSDHAQEHSLNCMRLAADCAQLAADTNRPVWRQHFLRMAKEWRSLAEIDLGAQDLTKK
jgi:hypothetical protein